MDKTPFAGLTRLAPGDPLSTDAYSFQRDNPTITDSLLRVGVLTHKHDGHAALGDPTAPPEVTMAAGAIPAATSIGACYTLVDAWGGETLASDAEIVSTPDPLPSPTAPPELAIDYDVGGDLVIGSYSYAVAIMDASGGVTPIGPSDTIERDPGHLTAKVTLSGLSDIVADSSGYGWRVYKAQNQSPMHFLASGLAAQDVLVDDGSLCGNCSETPPAFNTTGVSAGVMVAVASGYSSGATAVRIYLGEDGDFTSPALAGELTPAQAASGVIYGTVTVEDGQPPDVSTAVAGANQIDPDTDLLDWHWKRPVVASGDLPTPAALGDVRLVLDEGRTYFYSSAASAWAPTSDASGASGADALIINDGYGGDMPVTPRLTALGYNVYPHTRSGNEVQALDLVGATAGSFTLTFDGQTTAPIAYNATGPAVQAALEALSNVAPGDITVSTAGVTPGQIPAAWAWPYTYTFTFGGAYAATNVPQMVVDASLLTVTSVSMTRLATGHETWTEFEVIGGHEFYIAPTFAANWSDFGGIYVPTRFWTEDAGQITHLMGHVKRSAAPAAGSTIFVLPVGYRPAKAHTFAVAAGDAVANTRAFGSVDILPAGDVKWYAGAVGGSANQFISLDGVSFPVGY